MRISYTETRSMPIMYRTWFMDRIIRDFEEKKDSARKATSNLAETSATADRVLRRF
jgi:hypothetical protein